MSEIAVCGEEAVARAPSAEALEAAKDIREELMRMVFMGDGEVTLPAGHLSVIAARIELYARAAIAAHTTEVREAGYRIVPAEPTDEMVEDADDAFWDAWKSGKAENRKSRNDPTYDGIAGAQFLPQTIRAAIAAAPPYPPDLAEKIAERAAKRGRPRTDRERFANLRKALTKLANDTEGKT